MKYILPWSPYGRALAETSTDFLDAKVRGRRGAMWRTEDLHGLAAIGSVRELAARLYPRTDIQDHFHLERRMLAACVAELASFLPYLSGAGEELYAALLDRYPIENLKVLLRLLGGRDGQRAEELLVELPAALALPAGPFIESGDVEAFVEQIPFPTVRKCARETLPLYTETGCKAFLEMAFDRGYWMRVRDARQRWSGPVAAECEAARLLATLRAARVYDLPWERIRALLPPPGPGGLEGGALAQIHADPSAGNLIRLLPWLERLADGPDELEDTGRLEERLWHRAVRLADRQYYMTFDGYGALIGYYYLKREELRHLLSITQMLRSGGAGADGPARYVM